MNLDEMKREIDRMLREMNRGEMVAPSGNNKVALKQISDVLDELDRAIGSLRFLDHVAKRGSEADAESEADRIRGLPDTRTETVEVKR